MSLAGAVSELNLVFQDFRAAALDFSKRPPGRALDVFQELHLPMLALVPFFAALCPYRWAFKGGVSIGKHIILPVILILAVLMLAALFDRVTEHTEPPEIGAPPQMRNLALYLHLPVSATAPFFFLHPLIGVLMVLVAAGYAGWISIRSVSRIRRITLMRSLTQYISAAILALIPLIVLVAGMNMFRTLLNLGRIF